MQIIKAGGGGVYSKKAFTLIELLVVVFIIGILAVVTLPQYQKSVQKSHYTQLITAAKAIKDSAERYYQENGSYMKSWDELDIDFPFTTECSSVDLLCSRRFGGALRMDLNASNIVGVSHGTSDAAAFIYYAIWFDHSGVRSGSRECWARDEKAESFCRTLGVESDNPSQYSGCLTCKVFTVK